MCVHLVPISHQGKKLLKTITFFLSWCLISTNNEAVLVRVVLSVA